MTYVLRYRNRRLNIKHIPHYLLSLNCIICIPIGTITGSMLTLTLGVVTTMMYYYFDFCGLGCLMLDELSAVDANEGNQGQMHPAWRTI